MKTHDKWGSDRGSVLTFGIGLSILLLMVITVSVNIASLWTTKVTLRTIADGAALSGAQAVDVSNIYRSGLTVPVRLSPSLARLKVEDYLRQPAVRSRVNSLRIVDTHVEGSQIKVVLSCEPNLPFGYLLPIQTSRIQVVAMARQQVD